MMLDTLLIILLIGHVASYETNTSIPVVVNTWPWPQATDAAWEVVCKSSLDAVVAGCTKCEEDQCDGTVGYGGSPDESGETTLDAMIMDGTTFNIGAVGALRSVKNAIGVARAVLDHTSHTMLVGELATNFAVQMGFTKESLETNHSKAMHTHWQQNKCQPNYWTNVTPDPTTKCGPYRPTYSGPVSMKQRNIDRYNHDTIGMIAIHSSGAISAGTSTNGMNHKIPGRVGDSPIPGAGAYADDTIGAAVATGDGDIMMRFLPALRCVEKLRSGFTPAQAAVDAIETIVRYYPNFSGAILVLSKDGSVGAACTGFDKFPFCIRNADSDKTIIHKVKCGVK